MMTRHKFLVPPEDYIIKHINDEGIYLHLKSLGNVAFLMIIRKNYDDESFQFFKDENTNLKEQPLIPLQPRSLGMFMDKDENLEFIKEIMQIFSVDKYFALDINDWAIEVFKPYEPENSGFRDDEREKKVHEEILEEIAKDDFEREKRDLADDWEEKVMTEHNQSILEDNKENRNDIGS